MLVVSRLLHTGILDIAIVLDIAVVVGRVFLPDHFVGFLVGAGVVVGGRDLRGVHVFFFLRLV
jgi:hypothetical protein